MCNTACSTCPYGLWTLLGKRRLCRCTMFALTSFCASDKHSCPPAVLRRRLVPANCSHYAGLCGVRARKRSRPRPAADAEPAVPHIHCCSGLDVWASICSCTHLAPLESEVRNQVLCNRLKVTDAVGILKMEQQVPVSTCGASGRQMTKSAHVRFPHPAHQCRRSRKFQVRTDLHFSRLADDHSPQAHMPAACAMDTQQAAGTYRVALAHLHPGAGAARSCATVLR